MNTKLVILFTLLLIVGGCCISLAYDVGGDTYLYRRSVINAPDGLIAPLSGSNGGFSNIDGGSQEIYYGYTYGSSYLYYNDENDTALSNGTEQYKLQTYPQSSESGSKPTSAPVFFMPLDNATNANDYGGSVSDDGTFYGNLPTRVDGSVGYAQSLDGNGDYISVSDSSDLDISGDEITITFWINRTGNCGGDFTYCNIVNKESDSWSGEYGALLYNDGTIKFLIDAVSNVDSGIDVIPTGTPKFVFMRYNGSAMVTYVNNTLEASATGLAGNIGTNNEPLQIGRSGSGVGDVSWLNAEMSNIRIYNRALTDSERTDLWNSYTQTQLGSEEIEYLNWSGWADKRPIQVNMSGLGNSTVNDTPVLIQIDSANLTGAYSNYSDVRFATNCTNNAQVLGYWNHPNMTNSSQLASWVSVDEINSTICVWWNNSEATSTTGDINDVFGSNLELAYFFDEGSGSSVYDYSENNRDASATNFTGDEWVSGVFKNSKAISFNETNSEYIDTGTGFQTSSEHSIVAWVKTDDPTNDTFQVIASHYDSPGYWLGGAYNYPNQGVILNWVRNTTGDEDSTYTDNTYADGSWKHIVLTRDPAHTGTSRLHTIINGSVVATTVNNNQTAGSVSYAGNWLIGQRGDDLGFFNGTVGSILIYSSNITEERASDQYNSSLVSYEVDTTPPSEVSNLQGIAGGTYVNWTWTDPPESDYSHVKIYFEGEFKSDVAGGVEHYNVTELSGGTNYTLSTRTVDDWGNIGSWENITVETNTTTSLSWSLKKTFDKGEHGANVDVIEPSRVGFNGSGYYLTNNRSFGQTVEFDTITTNVVEESPFNITSGVIDSAFDGEYYYVRMYNGSTYNLYRFEQPYVDKGNWTLLRADSGASRDFGFIAPTKDGTLLYSVPKSTGTPAPLYRSTDYGETWSKVLDSYDVGDDNTFWSIDQNTNGTIIVSEYHGTTASTLSGRYLWKSYNDGENWTLIVNNSINFNRHIHKCMFTENDNIYLSGGDTNNFLYISTDMGDSWTQLSTLWQAVALGIHPTNESIIYYGKDASGTDTLAKGVYNGTALVSTAIKSGDFNNFGMRTVKTYEDGWVYISGYCQRTAGEIYRSQGGADNFSWVTLVSWSGTGDEYSVPDMYPPKAYNKMYSYKSVPYTIARTTDDYGYSTVIDNRDMDYSGDLEITVEVSDDNFQTIKDSTTINISHGRNTYNIGSLQNAKYVRINSTASGTGSTIDSYSIRGTAVAVGVCGYTSGDWKVTSPTVCKQDVHVDPGHKLICEATLTMYNAKVTADGFESRTTVPLVCAGSGECAVFPR